MSNAKKKHLKILTNRQIFMLNMNKSQRFWHPYPFGCGCRCGCEIFMRISVDARIINVFTAYGDFFTDLYLCLWAKKNKPCQRLASTVMGRISITSIHSRNLRLLILIISGRNRPGPNLYTKFSGPSPARPEPGPLGPRARAGPEHSILHQLHI